MTKLIIKMIITKIFGTNLSLYTKLSLWLRRKPNHFKDLKDMTKQKLPNLCLICVCNFKISTLCKKILLQQLRILEAETVL